MKIETPSEHEASYVNREGFNSINVQLVCDADFVILNMNAQQPGSAHDAGILRRTQMFHDFEADPPPLQGHLLGVSGYMLR